MSDALEAIEDIKKEFKENGTPFKIKTKGQDIKIGDPNYDSFNPTNNKGVTTLSEDIYGFIKDTSLNDQKSLQDSLGKNIVGKRVKNITFYYPNPFSKEEDKILYKNSDYEILYISTVNIQDTDILYKIVVSN